MTPGWLSEAGSFRWHNSVEKLHFCSPHKRDFCFYAVGYFYRSPEKEKIKGKPGKLETFAINFSMVSLQTRLTHLCPAQPHETCSRPLVDNHIPQGKPQEALGTPYQRRVPSPSSVTEGTTPQTASPNWFKACSLLFLLTVKRLINASTFQKGRRTQQLQT